jgi:murein DD-endopeptidase MepM/ murein hydrolase activator NlpD
VNSLSQSKRLDKKRLTILIVPEGAAGVKRFSLPSFLPRIFFVSVGLAFLIYSFLFYDFLLSRVNMVNLQKLRALTRSQQAEIRYFVQNISSMEEQAKKLLVMEGQVRKELKEINEIKRTTKVTPAIPVKKPHLSGNDDSSAPEEQISILEKEKTQLGSRLHQGFLALRKQAIQREKNLKEIREFLRAQKSILLATPSLWPVLGRITSRFGETRRALYSGGTRPHNGLDIAAPVGTAVIAPADGVVSSAGWELQYGRYICISHGYGFSTMYGHLQEILVKPGAKVKKGQIIGKVGLSGKTNGPHLHYEVSFHGNPVNPGPFLTQTP